MGKSPFYLFYGTETFLIEEEIRQMIKRLIPLEEQELSVSKYDLLTVPIHEVIEDAETPSLFSKQKIIIAKNAYIFSGQKPSKSIEQNTEQLEELLETSTEHPTSTLIFWAPVEKVDERKKILKRFKKNGNVKVFNKLTEQTLLGWIKDIVANQHVNISDEASLLLIQIIGHDLQTLSQEINKLATYVGKNGMIDRKTVEDLSAKTLEQNIFLLIENISNLQFDQAFTLFYDLLKMKEEPIKMIALLARQFRMMLLAKELNRIGYSNKQIGSKISAHPFAVQIALKQAVKYDEKQLKQIIQKLADMDYEIKTGKKDKVLSLEMFMFYLNGLVKG